MNSKIEQKINYKFRDKNLLNLALSHPSYKNENNSVGYDNERLEFLGDSVLSLIVSQFLYQEFKDQPEGSLSKMRAFLVYNKSLTRYANSIDLGDEILISKGEEKTGGRNRPSNLENAFEALVGAIYLDGGFKSAQNFVYRFIKGQDVISPEMLKDYKSGLMEIVQKERNGNVIYETLSEKGPAHDRIFEVQVKVDGKIMGKGSDKSKKEAQQKAAKNALKELEDKSEK